MGSNRPVKKQKPDEEGAHKENLDCGMACQHLPAIVTQRITSFTATLSKFLPVTCYNPRMKHLKQFCIAHRVDHQARSCANRSGRSLVSTTSSAPRSFAFLSPFVKGRRRRAGGGQARGKLPKTRANGGGRSKDDGRRARGCRFQMG